MRFFLDRDDSGHWYVIPVSKRSRWEEWKNLNDDTEESWCAPFFAERINGAPSNVTFEKPEF